MSLEDTRRQIAQAQHEHYLRYRPIWQAYFDRQRKYRELMSAAQSAAHQATKEPSK